MNLYYNNYNKSRIEFIIGKNYLFFKSTEYLILNYLLRHFELKDIINRYP